MKIRKPRVLALLIALLMAVGGCAGLLIGAGTGVGTYAYIEGNLKRDYETTLPRVWDATLAALKQLRLKPDDKEHDAFNGRIKGKMADGSEFKINLKRISDKQTEVGVRIGVFGDRQKSEGIHETIAGELGKNKSKS